jgi:acyl dehydratase
MKVFNGTAELLAADGSDLGTSDWIEIDQGRIDKFAEATGDFQWIHVDPEKAATGPFGTTIAHGYLTVSLVPALLRQLYRVDGVRMSLNYGLGRVRFPAPVPTGSRVRATAKIAEVRRLDGAVQATLETVIELERSSKPACVVESIARYVD